MMMAADVLPCLRVVLSPRGNALRETVRQSLEIYPDLIHFWPQDGKLVRHQGLTRLPQRRVDARADLLACQPAREEAAVIANYPAKASKMLQGHLHCSLVAYRCAEMELPNVRCRLRLDLLA